MGHLTQAELDMVASHLNACPRKTPDFDTPADGLETLLH